MLGPSLVRNKVALVMGVANPRSIAWSCVETFARNGWKVIFTCQSERILSKTKPLVQTYGSDILGAFPCDVLRDFDVHLDVDGDDGSPRPLFQRHLADILQDRPLSAVVHSLAHAPNIKTTPLLQTTREDFLQAHEISAYSLLQVARHTQGFFVRGHDPNSGDGDESRGTINTIANVTGSITALSYLGAVRAIPGYHAMGPAKASLESIVRGLALELATATDTDSDPSTRPRIRVNAVSAGPLPTLAAKGGIAGFDQMRRDMELRAPLGNVIAEQVASTVQFLASEGANGITGQTIFVDGGYSIVGGPGRDAQSQR